MKSLFLLRHARATRSPEGDHERPLDQRGRDEAHRVGLFLSRLGSRPELVLTSSARRARTTAELAAAAGDWSCPLRPLDALYQSSPDSMLNEIATQDDRLDRVLVVGHEPGCSDLTRQLIGGGRLEFPAATLVRIDFDGSRWRDLAPGGGGLAWLVTPAQISAGAESPAVPELELSRMAGAVLEIERKYLLRALPPIRAGVDTADIDQGWLPGRRLRERIRRVRKETGDTYFRTLKFGKGVARIELEDETTEAVFDRLWSLTVECRVRKRRYQVPDGDLLWEIDEFLDRDLQLAEVELARASDRPPFPDWLAPYVVREVTEDPRYTNRALAELGVGTPSED